MGFFLRQVRRRAGGGDIVRTSRLESAEPVLGRGGDCDIVIADLGLELRHAVLRRAGLGRVIVEGLDRATFTASGTRVARVELALANGPRMGFGSHVMTLAQGETPDDVIVTVAEAALEVKTAGGKDVFKTHGGLFGRRRMAWGLGLGILVLSLVIPVGLALHGGQQRLAGLDQQWSSGPLSSGHHFLETDCKACHQQAFVQVRDEACKACHKPHATQALQLATQMRTRGSPFVPEASGDHAIPARLTAALPPAPEFGQRVNDWLARQFLPPGLRCTSCHGEHVGNGKPPVAKTPAPVLADALHGPDCAACHTGMSSRLADTRLVNVPDWNRHPEFRPLVRDAAGVLARASLSPQTRDVSGLKFPHRLHMQPGGGVARMATTLGRNAGYGAPLACANCHRPDDTGRNFQPVAMTRDCAACHSLAYVARGGQVRQLPHGDVAKTVVALLTDYAGPGSGAAAARAAFASGGACATCHAVTVSPDSALAFTIRPVRLTQHFLPAGGFDHAVPAHHLDSLGAPSCGACHKAEQSERAEDLLLPRLAACGACHGRSKAQAVQAAAADCAACHSYHAPSQPARWRQGEIGWKP